MQRTISCVVCFFLLGLGVAIARAQTEETPVLEQDSAHLEQLENIREGITDPEARPADRRRWANVLLSYDTPQSKALVVELLGLSDRPDVQRALCGMISELAREAPARVDAAFVDPLIALLGADMDDLRVLAAEALADVPGTDVPARLGELAAQAEVPLVKRLAAVDALAPNTHRREVVDQLIGLLDTGVPEVTERVAEALASAAPEAFGLDAARWRQWWEEKSRLSDEVWLAGQLRIYRDRSRRLTDEYRALLETSKSEQAAITARTRSFQRELFRALPPDGREARLVEWLDDPLPVVKLTALSIIRARIADEGQRPEGAVLASLLGQLRRGSPAVRREILDIVQNLNDPVVVEAVLAQLEREDDARTRHAIFKALGKLDSPAAIPALVAEIASSDSLPECIREAAIALGSVAAQAMTGEAQELAVAALKSRYHSSSEGDSAMRAALLTAMAGVANEAFAPELMGAIESDDAAILGPAIRGVLAIDGRSKLPRLRTLMGHADPRVRLAAIEAVGQLGREEVDLESLLTRLRPSIEANELAREAAWRGFRQMLTNRSVEDRIEAAGRLRDLPDLEIRYLEELADTPSVVNGDTAQFEVVLDRLAAVLVAQGRYEESTTHLRALYDMQTARADPSATGCGLRLLNATLRSPGEFQVAVLVEQLGALAGDDAARARIVDTVEEYLESPEVLADPQRARRLLADLDSVPADALGDAWKEVLEAATQRLESGDPGPTPPPPEPGD